MSMATIRTTITLGEDLADRARALGINVSAAARRGVADAVREAMAAVDRDGYSRHPEQLDDFWDDVVSWGAP